MTRVAFLAPMRPELRPLVKRLSLDVVPDGRGYSHAGSIGEIEVVAAMTGIGTQPAIDTTKLLLDSVDVDHVIVVGVAGGIGPTVEIGDLVVPEVVLDGDGGPAYRPDHLGATPARGTIITSDQFGYEQADLDRFVSDGVVALDMETASIAGVCEQRKVPWSAFRAISDRGDDDSVDPAMLKMAGPDGSGDGKEVVKYLARRPWRFIRLAKMGKDSMRAADRAAEAGIDAAKTLVASTA